MFSNRSDLTQNSGEKSGYWFSNIRGQKAFNFFLQVTNYNEVLFKYYKYKKFILTISSGTIQSPDLQNMQHQLKTHWLGIQSNCLTFARSNLKVMITYSLDKTILSSTMHFLFLVALGLSLLAGVEIVVNSGVLIPKWEK